MRTSWIVAAASLALLTACSSGGEADDAGNGTDASDATEAPSSFQQGLVSGFRRQFVASCMPGLTERGIDEGFAENVCGCMADSLTRDHEPMELAGLTEDDVAVAAAECAEQVEQPNG